jgi:hypothetical protein
VLTWAKVLLTVAKIVNSITTWFREQELKGIGAMAQREQDLKNDMERIAKSIDAGNGPAAPDDGLHVVDKNDRDNAAN